MKVKESTPVYMVDPHTGEGHEIDWPDSEDDEANVYWEPELRGGAFIQVLTEFHRDPSISIWAKGLYCLLLGYAGENSKAFPSLVTIGETLGCHRNKAGEIIDELCGLGIISKKRRFGRSTMYIVRKFNERFMKKKPGTR